MFTRLFPERPFVRFRSFEEIEKPREWPLSLSVQERRLLRTGSWSTGSQKQREPPWVFET
jgi:hypothetical protein